MTKVSAVMALYNTPLDLLKATVESVLAQSLTDFELIIIDDASSMEYKKFFSDFNDSRIKYFKLEKNAGPGHARNEGIKKSIGEYAAIVDSDDIYKPNRFEVQTKFLDENSDISLISCAFEQSNNGRISEVVENHEDIKIFMLFNSPFANPAVMFRRNVFVENKLFYSEDKNFGEDYELWIEAMFSGIKMANLNDVLMIYTRRKGQLSKTKSEMQVMMLKSLYKKILFELGILATDEELDLQYKIYTGKFARVSEKSLADWLNKVIEHNSVTEIFNEQKLKAKRDDILKEFGVLHNRIFKLKIGQKNLCIDKPFKIHFEKRN